MFWTIPIVVLTDDGTSFRIRGSRPVSYSTAPTHHRGRFLFPTFGGGSQFPPHDHGSHRDTIIQFSGLLPQSKRHIFGGRYRFDVLNHRLLIPRIVIPEVRGVATILFSVYLNDKLGLKFQINDDPRPLQHFKFEVTGHLHFGIKLNPINCPVLFLRNDVFRPLADADAGKSPFHVIPNPSI